MAEWVEKGGRVVRQCDEAEKGGGGAQVQLLFFWLLVQSYKSKRGIILSYKNQICQTQPKEYDIWTLKYRRYEESSFSVCLFTPSFTKHFNL
jgi:hypothetical protein